MKFKNITSSKFSTVLPVFVTFLMIVWTIIISPHTEYGDDWAIVPVLIIAPVVIVLHLFLIIMNKGKEKKIFFSFYGLIHILIFSLIWIGCLMKISKDSL